MNIDAAFPSKYLKASDFDEGNQVLTMDYVEVQTVGQGEDSEEKPILYFNETEKGLVLNKTNANTIKGLYGSDTDQWSGKRLELYGTEVQFGADMKPAVRIKSKAPNGPTVQNFKDANEALAAIVAAGLTKEDFKAILPEKDGKRMFSPERDSTAVRKLIAQNTPPEEPEMTEESIAF